MSKRKKEVWVRYVGTLGSLSQSWLGKRYLFIRDKVYPKPVSIDFFNFLAENIPDNFQVESGPDPEPEKIKIEIDEAIEPVAPEIPDSPIESKTEEEKIIKKRGRPKK